MTDLGWELGFFGIESRGNYTGCGDNKFIIMITYFVIVNFATY